VGRTGDGGHGDKAGATTKVRARPGWPWHIMEAVVPDEKKVLERQVEAVDGQIDRLVYELYGLTEEEIGMVEGIVEGQGIAARWQWNRSLGVVLRHRSYAGLGPGWRGRI